MGEPDQSCSSYSQKTQTLIVILTSRVITCVCFIQITLLTVHFFFYMHSAMSFTNHIAGFFVHSSTGQDAALSLIVIRLAHTHGCLLQYHWCACSPIFNVFISDTRPGKTTSKGTTALVVCYSNSAAFPLYLNNTLPAMLFLCILITLPVLLFLCI